MVVAKRPLAPPASARTSSTQQAQRARGKPPVAAPNGSDNTNSVAVELSHEDGPQNPDAVADNSPSSKKGPKSKSKSKQKKSAKKASRKIHRLGDYLFRIILIWLTIYTFALCPEDVRSERPVCRALSEYRRLVLEPYVLPPIRVALSHPSVVPYVEKAKPYTDRAFNTAKPVAQVIVRQWNARVAPQWNRHVVPLWYRYAIPQLLQLDAKVTPYRNRVTDEYERRVAPIMDSVSPYAQQAVVNARLLRSKARPYVMTAAHKTYDGYQYVAPYARPTWNKVKALVARFIALLAEQRRQFVDPHVRKIWERVKELSSGTPKVPAAVDVRASVSSRVSRAAEGAASVASSLMSSSTHAPDVTVPESQASDAPLVAAVDITETVTSVASEVANTLEDTASVISALTSQPAVRVSSSISSLSDTSAFVAAESISSLLSSGSGVIGSSASSAVGAASTGILHASDALSSSIQRAASVASPESIASSASGIASAASSAVSSLAGRASSSGALTASAASVVPDIDLDAFAEELGLNDILAEASGSASGTAMDADTAPAPVDTEAAEEQERRRHKRLQETAEKRANVEARHSRWEDEQAALIENNKRSLRRALIALRKAAAAELRESTEIRAEIESFVARAEDLLKGAEKYLQTLVKDQRPDEEKRQLLERVLDKVNEKFTDRLSETEAVMNGWYAPWLDKEVAEVRKVAEAVKDHAENAQVDIGMDYAYLDDTTYQDWQRYHDLVRRSENFTQEAEAMQNGTSVSPPANALLKELKAIQTEVEDVVVGFETRLRRIRRNNARAFGESVKEDVTDADDEIVSILPIEDKDKDKVQSPVDVDVPPVVIGRSKEEVMEALDRIVEADGDATSSPQATEQSADPESEVKGLVEEVSTGQSVPSISPVASHEEL
ncbi:uncharacterized protein B0H18DRAFT_983356 [Fomitopsis serialis]|uniref:uncharacterized protein n=1 Tax=Fomitopsis serialis TaxID=139415 RepID=UPI002007DB54|nr:uncharacterized protein B0H18DRAFT_983356 [Neoantrodia serialis]KAH9933371.1 hypothetical protein B0H18DRAFT_983356 [Neoantrodia serialis]